MRSKSALRSEQRGRWFESSHSDHSLRAMIRISRAFSARRQHWSAARSYKPGQRTAVDGRDRNPGRRPSTEQEVDMQAHPALVLNADFRPLSYFPLSVMPWQVAVAAVVKDTVAVVAHYDKWVRSPSTRIQLPSVVALRAYLPVPTRVAFTRFNVFLRDRFRCQYCGGKLAAKDLTFEHVIPR